MKKTLLALSLSGLAWAQPAGWSKARPTYCNPVDLDYKYNFEQLPERISYR